MIPFKTTKELKVSKKLVEQVIGQDRAVNIVKRAAKQRRNILLIGPPGTGKSMIAQAMSELLPVIELEDIIIYRNKRNENRPKVLVVKTYPNYNYLSKNPQYIPYYTREEIEYIRKLSNVNHLSELPKYLRTGLGRRIVDRANSSVKSIINNKSSMFNPFLVIASIIIIGALLYPGIDTDTKWLVIGGTLGIGLLYLLSTAAGSLGQRMIPKASDKPKLIVDNTGKKSAPFVDGTGTKAGALLGDVKHDPLQCIPGDEFVSTASGRPVRIKNLVDPVARGEGVTELKEKERFQVLGGVNKSYCYSPTTVFRVYKNKYNNYLYEIRTRRGLKLKVTYNHPVAVINEEGNIEYIEAQNLKSDHTLVLPYRLPIYKKQTLKREEIKLFAYILADGYISTRTIGFKLKRQFKIDEIERCIKANKLKHTKRVYKGATIININSVKKVKELLSLGLKENNKKTIPKIIYDLDKESIILFMSSYLSLDGYVNKQGQFELFSKELIPYFVPLLMKIGIRPKVKYRVDPGFGNKLNKEQEYVLFSNYAFAQKYENLTFNPIHKKNLLKYLSEHEGTHVTFDDVIPLSFNFLEKIRILSGLSKNKVHKSYYSLKSGLKTSQSLTRGFLSEVCKSLLNSTNGPNLMRLDLLSKGSYAYDNIVSIKKVRYKGYVYNLTTGTGNYLVDNVLTHNSGGLGTPAHYRVEAGEIHRANKGVLFIDEIASLKLNWQQELLTAMQEKKYSITGQSEMSSGALVHTEPIPSDFVLIAAGNLPDLKQLHPALRSRIRGSGYEIYVEQMMEDNKKNRNKLAMFVAQEVKKDKKIPAFTRGAVLEIIKEARKMSGRKKKLTLNLRELGGLVRSAGDIAVDENAEYTTDKHVIAAKKVFRSIEYQLSDKMIEQRRAYEMVLNKNAQVGRVNGLAVLGESSAGIVLPIEAEVTPASSSEEGKLIATGKLGDIAKEAVANVSAIIKRHVGTGITKKDIHVQFLQAYNVEGDSASIGIAIAVLSAFTGIPIKQDVAITGSLSIRGEVLPVGGVSAKIEAAAKAGIKTVIIPYKNKDDVVLEKKYEKKIKIIPVKTLTEALNIGLKNGKQKTSLLKKFKKMF